MDKSGVPPPAGGKWGTNQKECPLTYGVALSTDCSSVVRKAGAAGRKMLGACARQPRPVSATLSGACVERAEGAFKGVETVEACVDACLNDGECSHVAWLGRPEGVCACRERHADGGCVSDARAPAEVFGAPGGPSLGRVAEAACTAQTSARACVLAHEHGGKPVEPRGL